MMTAGALSQAQADEQWAGTPGLVREQARAPQIRSHRRRLSPATAGAAGATCLHLARSPPGSPPGPAARAQSLPAAPAGPARGPPGVWKLTVTRDSTRSAARDQRNRRPAAATDSEMSGDGPGGPPAATECGGEPD